MWRISEILRKSGITRRNPKSSGPGARRTRDARPVRACLVALAVFLNTVALFPDARPGHCRQSERGGNATVLTNTPPESDTRIIWSKAAEDAALDPTPGNPGLPTRFQRRNPEMVKKAKIEMQLEANSEPIRPEKGANPAPGPSRPEIGPQPSPGNTTTPGEELTYMQLPSRIRDSIPLGLTMLVYSKRPDYRSITINSSRMHEGQEVSPGLKVEEITSDGAVFSYHGYRFRKRVVGD